MLRQSSLIFENSHARSAKEGKYYIIFAVTLFICGALLLIIFALNRSGIFIIAVSWVLIVVLAFDLLRPFLYNRGVADAVMVIFTGLFYVILEYVIGKNLYAIENYRLLICIALFLAGISRILAFARMIVVINLPLMPICGFAEIMAASMIFVGWPDNNAAIIYWFLGMTVILSGFESVSEAAKLRT
jgi:hypothetical protein